MRWLGGEQEKARVLYDLFDSKRDLRWLMHCFAKFSLRCDRGPGPLFRPAGNNLRSKNPKLEPDYVRGTVVVDLFNSFGAVADDIRLSCMMKRLET